VIGNGGFRLWDKAIAGDLCDGNLVLGAQEDRRDGDGSLLPDRLEGLRALNGRGKGKLVQRDAGFFWQFAVVVLTLAAPDPEDRPALEQDGPPALGYRLDTGDQLRVTVSSA
jgi:hypothetical protein